MAVAVFMDLAAADRLGSVMGAIAGLVGLALSVWALAGVGRLSIEAYEGGVASGGHVGRVITGHRNATPPRAAAARRNPPASGSVRASGAGSTAAAGDVDEVITGDGNRT
ncbi:hypothetical protein [Streptomyces sp. MBT62]|uniref:hypothetical protein n=1 Tax=Streptomyces sp. MBT62 TaxID=2800410 RepID=UPI00190C7333|nr:hypothetical protein [Streptomyces sp. MBT62]MBK3570016.1 hypothetical protein [Streptomyces sp. MBT62]